MLDHTKQLLEKLQSDTGFRDGVADFIRSQGFFCTPDELKHLASEVLMHCREEDSRYYKHTGARTCPYSGTLHGYEYWVG